MGQNKIALVTGGSRGLGKDMALKLAQKGLDVMVTYHSKREEAADVVSQIIQSGGNAAAIRLNVGDISTFNTFLEELCQVLMDQFDATGIDYLINNAGVGINAPFKSTTEAQFDELLNVNFKGVYFLTQTLLPYLNNGGGIVNISSRLAQSSVPGYSAYAAMKGAVETLTRYQAKEPAQGVFA